MMLNTTDVWKMEELDILLETKRYPYQIHFPMDISKSSSSLEYKPKV